jgi:uncharacterized protein YaeQ
VYSHKDATRLVQQLAGARIHRREHVEVVALDRSLIAALIERMDRRMKLELSVTEGHLYLTIAGETLEGVLERLALGG